jgi:hypothetical protein
MADDVAMPVQFGAEEPLVEFPAEGLTVSVPITHVSDNLYRIDGVQSNRVTSCEKSASESESM